MRFVGTLNVPSVNSLPVSGTTGQLLSYNDVIYNWNGSSWETLAGGGGTSIYSGVFAGALLRIDSTKGVTPPYNIIWDSSDYNTNSFWSSGTNPTRITIPSGVTKIRLTAGVDPASTLATNANLIVSICKNGTYTDSGVIARQIGFNDTSGSSVSVSSAIISVSANDYFEIRIDSEDTSFDIESNPATYFGIEIIQGSLIETPEYTWKVTGVGTGSSQDITIPEEVELSDIIMFVEGVYQHDGFSVSGTTVTTTQPSGFDIEIVKFSANAPVAWAVTAVGTGSSQNITLPVLDAATEAVLVFVNGVRFHSAEYSIAGTNLTMTSNSADDAIEIVGLAYSTLDLTSKADSGAITSSGLTTSTAKILGRVTASTGAIEELSGTQATTLMDTFTDSLKGLVPASGGGTSNFLRADGSWVTNITLPAGGTTGQVLKKTSNTDYDVEWVSLPRIIAGFFVSTPTSNETLLFYTAVETVTFPANFSGSYGNIGINPTSSFVMDVYKNPTFTGNSITGGTQIGTITISTGGVFTFTTTGGTSQSLSAGDSLGIKAPISEDATAACGSWTLVGLL